jgi:hypothetical protein
MDEVQNATAEEVCIDNEHLKSLARCAADVVVDW